MAINLSDTPHLEKFKLIATTAWKWVDGTRIRDPRAVDFSPPSTEEKPVLYLPIKRRGGQEVFPEVRLEIELVESELRRLNFDTPTLLGAEVNAQASNLFLAFVGNSFPLKLPSGRLETGLRCSILIDADLIKKLLDPSGPMRARLNENLLSAVIEIPAIIIDGNPLQAVSTNRLFLYRRKSIVFLPGVFGSQFQVDAGKNKKDAFPNFLNDDALLRFLPPSVVEIVADAAKQRIGVLECDSQGEPILPGFQPKLLRFGGFVYDTFEKVRAARHNRLTPVPDDFLVYDLRLFAYDWRVDLATAATQMVDRLRKLQLDELLGGPDTDDQVAIAGHSTGGVIIRKMLGEPGIEDLVSHAFFLNVPFRGAPKALSVFLTGGDPPGGAPMIPFIDANSLRNIANCAPIVYHLAPSFAFPTPVSEIPGGIPPGPNEIREREKKAFIDSAIDHGAYFLRLSVDHQRLPGDLRERGRVAGGADAWSEFVDVATTVKSGEALYIHLEDLAEQLNTTSPAAQNEKAILPNELSKRHLEFQKSLRVPVGWNNDLVQKALAFHKQSENIAANGNWKDKVKAFIFFSKGHPTTGRLVISDFPEKDLTNDLLALLQPTNSLDDMADGTAHPPPPEPIGDKLRVEQWRENNGRLFKRISVISRETEDGDGTVPLRSLLGFGGPAKVFQALPANPEHVPAPNSDFLWARVMEILQADDRFEQFLLPNPDTKNGRES